MNWIPLLLAGAAAALAGGNQQAWLAAHPGYRLAIDADCECADEIEELRQGDGDAWKPQPDFHPYYATGDFDGDGLADVAVVALPRKPDDPILIVVLWGAKREATVIPKGGESIADRGLFIAREQPKKHPVLLFGAFGSEAEPVPITPTR